MWRDPQKERKVYCPKCNGLCENSEVLSPVFMKKCKTCFATYPQRLYKCMHSNCGSYVRVCSCSQNLMLETSIEYRELPFRGDSSIINNKVRLCGSTVLASAILVTTIGIIAYIYYKATETSGNKNLAIIERLKRDYPSQKNETWYHFLSMLDKEVPSVKSITFLHTKDKATSDCLAKDLVFLYTKNKSLKSEDITFSDFGAVEYGFVLQHYQTVVQKFGVFITDLGKISGNLARIFHSLCDDVSSEIKPSLFIFTVKYDEMSKTLKPIERATSVLRKAWNHLPENELAPLLSRVVRNVVDIIPEPLIMC